jgi:jumonji domain-containing protein 7
MNGSSYHVLDYPPTPLEFARLAHLSRPAVIKGITITLCATPVRLTRCFSGVEFPALTKWTDDYLVEKMGDQSVSVAVTPNGYGSTFTAV